MFAIFNNKKILIEIKYWKHQVPFFAIKYLVHQLQSSILAEKADGAIIVTKSSLKLPHEILKNTKIKIMSLKDLRNYLEYNTQ